MQARGMIALLDDRRKAAVMDRRGTECVLQPSTRETVGRQVEESYLA